MLNSHLTVLKASAALYPSSPAFKTPQLDASLNNTVEEWRSISYAQFLADVETSARYWTRMFKTRAIPDRSVIGLWIGGFTYTDALHVYGISRAGYIPQLFSLRLPNPEIIYELLDQANAKALIYDSTVFANLDGCSLPTYQASFPEESNANGSLADIALGENDLAFIFHTSGSTSGSPKLVPCSYGWLNGVVLKSGKVSHPGASGRQDVTVWMGSMCHIGQSFMLIGSLQHGGCVIQPTAISFSSEELIDMVLRCGLNRLNQFAPFLAVHLRKSRSDVKLLSVLSELDEVLYSGLPLPHDEELWAYKNGILLKNLFGSTECGAMLLSIGGKGTNSPLLRPIEGVSYEFRPVTPANVEVSYQSTAMLFELVILANSVDCPHASLRHPDGGFHTGDLFQEIAPGSYVFRGRDDDWIKSENSLRCDTKAIEDNVRTMCGTLVTECVVVGSGRPSPVMFVEPAGDMDKENLKKEIIRKTRQFHSRRYIHERITSTKMIVVVPPETLPRTATKGNVRRKAVEETFKTQLDQIYGAPIESDYHNGSISAITLINS
ncbi:hypothetical protein BDZ94DRAFT_1265122 [Collybia nuda]|uniref:AMP-dependent synthetase/ligase domain-containing protein n=1 Tax=Collybia nuda TaxID=64659 RepID=A0A9P5XZV0_9AGAR|nr:hypothetical protein BDZ94DRAFT_1265122 [Collybia nuda]